MTTLRNNVLIALAAIGFASAAVAQTAAVPSTEGRHGHAMSVEQRAAHRAERRANMAERQAQRAAKLRAELKLTAQQEPAFAAFLAAGKPAQRPLDRTGDARTRLAALSAPQRMALRLERQKQRIARMEARLAALNSFYAVLTPEQRQVMDSKKMRAGGKHWRHHGHHGAHAAAMQS